jgi:hypothetical protein
VNLRDEVRIILDKVYQVRGHLTIVSERHKDVNVSLLSVLANAEIAPD